MSNQRSVESRSYFDVAWVAAISHLTALLVEKDSTAKPDATAEDSALCQGYSQIGSYGSRLVTRLVQLIYDRISTSVPKIMDTQGFCSGLWVPVICLCTVSDIKPIMIGPVNCGVNIVVRQTKFATFSEEAMKACDVGVFAMICCVVAAQSGYSSAHGQLTIVNPPKYGLKEQITKL
jgi:hypothetical protein